MQRNGMLIVILPKGSTVACGDSISKLIEFNGPMLILFTAILLLGGAASLAALRLVVPRFRFNWLVGVSITALALLSVLSWWPQLPVSLELPVWKAAGPVRLLPTFSVSDLSWPYALSLIGLALAGLLTAPAREESSNAIKWAICLGVAGLGLLSVVAGNALTLVMLWAILDLAELGMILQWGEGRSVSERAVATFSIRVGSIALVLLAQVLGSGAGQFVEFGTMPAPDGLLLLVAVAARLGTYAAPLPPGSAAFLRSGVGITLQITAAAAGLGVVSHLPVTSLASPAAPILLLLLCAAAALYAGWMWLRAPDELVGRPLWIFGTSALALAAMLRGNPIGATAWGVVLILVGGALFLTSVQHTWLKRLILIGAWTASSLPFSVTAIAGTTSSGTLDWSLPALLIAQALLVAGFVHHATRPSTGTLFDTQAVWVKGVYPVGIGLLLVLQVLLAVWGWPGALQITWIPGVVVCVIAAGLVWGRRRIPALNPVPSQWMPRVSTGAANLAYQVLSRVYRGLQQVGDTIAGVLEGQAGIMWSVLLLALFVLLVGGGKP